jgi:hypothetical protein
LYANLSTWRALCCRYMDYLCISSQVLNVSNAANDLGSQADVHVLIIVHNYVVQNLDVYFQSRYYVYGCASFL